jgi:predicted amidohydrolase YtcJ
VRRLRGQTNEEIVCVRLRWVVVGIWFHPASRRSESYFVPKDSLTQELRGLRLVFSSQDIIKTMTRNAAAVIGRSKDIGTLESGKLADMVMLDGNPLANIEDLLKVKVVIKAGQIVVDKR